MLKRKGYDSPDTVRDKGKPEGELGLVLRPLDKRLGGLTPALAAQIPRLDSGQLNALGEALLDFG